MQKNISGIDKVISVIFLISLFIYIYLYFQQCLWNILLYKDNINVDNNSIWSFYKSILGLILVFSCIIFRLRTRLRLSRLGYVFLLYSFYMFLVTILNPENISLRNYINQYINMTLWIYVYLFFFTFFGCYEISFKKYNYSVYISSIFLFSLFIFNYITISNRGISFSLIESYFCIMMIPFVLLQKQKVKYIIIFLIIIASLLASKRTGIMTLLISLFVFYLISERKITKKIKVLSMFLIFAFFVFIISDTFFNEQLNLILERFSNISDDGGSGRDIVFADVLNLIHNSSTSNFIFGHGYNTVIDIIGFSAHNDFLEVFYDFGLVGFLIYCCIYFVIIYNIKKEPNIKIRSSLIVSFLLIFLTSLASHLVLFPTSLICLCAFWGVVDSKNKCLNN